MSDQRKDENGQGAGEEHEMAEVLANLPSAPSPVDPAGVGVPDVPLALVGIADEPDADADDEESVKRRMASAYEATVRLFEHLGADVDVEVRDTESAIVCQVKVKRGAAILQVGPRGQVLESVQYLISRIASRGVEGRKRISVEVGGFRDEASEPAMIEMAQRLAGSARKLGKTLTIVPIQARDRRVIHTSLAGMPGIKTRSEGEGNLRRLLIEVEGTPVEGENDGDP